jgi:hypothetical protein
MIVGRGRAKGVAKALVTDELWKAIEPVLPE